MSEKNDNTGCLFTFFNIIFGFVVFTVLTVCIFDDCWRGKYWLIISCLLYIASIIVKYSVKGKETLDNDKKEKIILICNKISFILGCIVIVALATAIVGDSGSSGSSLNGDGKWHTSKSDYGVYRYKKQGNGWAVQHY